MPRGFIAALLDLAAAVLRCAAALRRGLDRLRDYFAPDSITAIAVRPVTFTAGRRGESPDAEQLAWEHFTGQRGESPDEQLAHLVVAEATVVEAAVVTCRPPESRKRVERFYRDNPAATHADWVAEFPGGPPAHTLLLCDDVGAIVGTVDVEIRAVWGAPGRAPSRRTLRFTSGAIHRRVDAVSAIGAFTLDRIVQDACRRDHDPGGT